MSRKTVSRGATAAALATLLTLASAAPSLAAPRPTGERGLRAQTGVWSLVLDLSKRLAGWAFGVDRTHKAIPVSSGDTADIGFGSDPNGNQVGVDTSEPIGVGGHG